MIPRKLFIPALFFAVLIVGGCAGLFLKPPSVTLADIKIIDVGLLEQRFAFKLRVQNPNDREIAITGLSFEVEINGKPFAKGVSNKPVTIPRLEEKILEVRAVSNLYGLLIQLKELVEGKNQGLSYRIKGRLMTDPFGELEFDEGGKLDLPKPDTGNVT
jgi:LEA14-like dessication related protein